MGASLSRSVEIQISNKTWNISLRNARIYFKCGYCPHSSMPEMSPGSSGICYFSASYLLCGVAGVLVYEAESFTLAIYFSNPFTYSKFPRALGLELSPGKAHLGRLEDIYTRMVDGTYSSSDPDIKFSRVVVGKSHGTIEVSNGPIKVTATMSDSNKSILKVVLEEQEGSEEEACAENFRRRRHYQEN